MLHKARTLTFKRSAVTYRILHRKDEEKLPGADRSSAVLLTAGSEARTLLSTGACHAGAAALMQQMRRKHLLTLVAVDWLCHLRTCHEALQSSSKISW